MGIEVPKKFGGCEFSFTSSIITVEGMNENNKLWIIYLSRTCQS